MEVDEAVVPTHPSKVIDIPDHPKVVVSGDRIRIPDTSKLVMGPGLLFENGFARVTTPGVLRTTKKMIGIDRNHRRYVPVTEERVIGVVLGHAQDNYRVDIGAAHVAMMSTIAFEGATQRNKPDLKVGNLVYARIIAANKDVEPELACVERNGKSEGLQVLEKGHLVTCSLGLCRKLRTPKSPLLVPLTKQFQLFELCIGMNGRVWVVSDSLKHTIVISMYLRQCEDMCHSELETLLKQLVKSAG